MKIPISDFYLLRIAYFGERDSPASEDFSEYLTRAIKSRRCHDAEIEADFMMLALMGTHHVRNRLFTWEEYEILSHTALFIEIETKHPVEAELTAFVRQLREILEPKLRISHCRSSQVNQQGQDPA